MGKSTVRVIVHSRVNHYADWHGGCMFYLEWHLAHRLVSPLDSCLIIRSDNENISIPRLFTAMPCEVAESHMITVF